MNKRILFAHALLCIALFEGPVTAQQSAAQEQKQQRSCLRRLYDATFGRGRIEHEKYKLRLISLEALGYSDAKEKAKVLSEGTIKTLQRRYAVIHALGFKNAQDITWGMNDADVENLKQRYEILNKLGFDNAHDMAQRKTEESVEMLKDLCAVGIEKGLAERLNRQHSLEEQRGIFFLLRNSGLLSQREAIDYGIAFAHDKKRLAAIKEASMQGSYAVKSLLKDILAYDATIRAAEAQAGGILDRAGLQARNELAVARVQAQAFLEAEKRKAEIVREEARAYLASVREEARAVIGKQAGEVADKVSNEVSTGFKRDVQKVRNEVSHDMQKETTAINKRLDDIVNKITKMKAQQPVAANDAPPAYVRPDGQPPKYEDVVGQPPSYAESVSDRR